MRHIRVKLFIIFAIIGVGVFLFFQQKRTAASGRLMAEEKSIIAEKARLDAAVGELERLKRLFPSDAGISTFLDDLYLCARQAGVRNHEVITQGLGLSGQGASAGTPRRAGTVSGPEMLNASQLKITLDGSYRQVAEYIRQVQNMERFKRITDFEVKPENGALRTTINLELFSLKESHGR